MYLRGTETTAPATGWNAFGSWVLDATKTYFSYDLQQSQLEAAKILQAQGLTPAQAQAAVSSGNMVATQPSALSNPLIIGGLLLLGAVGVYVLAGKKRR